MDEGYESISETNIQKAEWINSGIQNLIDVENLKVKSIYKA